MLASCAGGGAESRHDSLSPRNVTTQKPIISACEDATETSDSHPIRSAQRYPVAGQLITFRLRVKRPLGEWVAGGDGVDAIAIDSTGPWSGSPALAEVSLQEGSLAQEMPRCHYVLLGKKGVC